MKPLLLIILTTLCWQLTATAQQFGSFLDQRDNRRYKTVTIGKQTWMAENLKYLPPLDSYGSRTLYIAGVSGYKNDEAMSSTYGRMYTWSAVQKACPPGWRLPTRTDWAILVNNYGGFSQPDKGGNLGGDPVFYDLTLGGKSGFNMLLGGAFRPNLGFYALDTVTYLWSSSNYDKFFPGQFKWTVEFNGLYAYVIGGRSDAGSSRLYCRCIKN